MLTQKQMSEFKELLEKRKMQIDKNLNGTAFELEQMSGQELNDDGDFAAASTETVIDSAILEQQRKELAEIDLALDKISRGTYGVCEMCEEPIGIERLKVKNFARYCMPCREITEKEHD
jgi:DnaK suppressor protein